METVPKELRDFFAAHPKAALAFSGGVDSAYLLYAAKSCGAGVRAYFAQSAFQPGFELKDAKRLAAGQGAALTVVPLDVLADEKIAANTAERCYWCKRRIMNAVLEKAAADGYTLLMDGSNASDDADGRPGMRALAELGVCSPLRQAGITKRQVRGFSKAAGLFTWDKPAYACLATRVPAGTPLCADTLRRVEAAEGALMALGFSDLRVRVQGGRATLQLPERQFPLAAQMRRQVADALLAQFEQAVLDLTPRETENGPEGMDG